LVRGGEIIAAAQEERFSRKKRDPRFPKEAINYCLGEAFIDPSALDAVAFYDGPVVSPGSLAKNDLSTASAGRESLVAEMSSTAGMETKLTQEVEDYLGLVPRLLFTPYPMAQAASCFYPSPYEAAAIVTIDGVRDGATCTLGVGQGTRIELIHEIQHPHALGLLYRAFSDFCGFEGYSGEEKLMGLAFYGEPRFADAIRDELVDIQDDGSFQLHPEALGFLDASLMTTERFEAIFGGPARAPDEQPGKREADIAASVQVVAEDIVLRLVAYLMKETGQRTLTVAGGIALNCLANGRVIRESGLDKVFMQPAAGAAGGALGAALHGAHAVFEAPRKVSASGDGLSGSLLGPAFSTYEAEAFVDRHDVPSHLIEDDHERSQAAAKALAEGAVVGFFSGRMEFGPRALGARSVLGDPRDPDMPRKMNLNLKNCESIHPLAAAILEAHTHSYFELDEESPYMLSVAPVRDGRRQFTTPDQREQQIDDDDILSGLKQARSDIPAVTHLDHSARLQTVGEKANPAFRLLLKKFHELTGCPLVVNTSFNTFDEPIVCAPEDAYRCFMNSGMDLLVLENRLLWKHEQSLTDKWRIDRDAD